MDGEFEKVREETPDVEMNTAAAHKHVTDIERGICTLKECCRCIVSDLRVTEIQCFHKWIVVHCVYFVTKMVNSFGANLGASQAFSPCRIVMGQSLDIRFNLSTQFGSYVEASYANIIKNDMIDRTHG